MKNTRGLSISKIVGQLLIIGVTFGVVGAGAVGNKHETVVAQAKSATFHKGGHLWYRGSGKHGMNVEVMPKKIRVSVHGSYTVPKNKTKHFRLYTVKGMPVIPTKKAGYPAPAYSGQWMQITTGAWGNDKDFKKFPKIIQKYWGKRYMVTFSGNTLLQYEGTPVKTFNLPAVHGTVLTYQTADDIGNGNTLVVPSSAANTDLTQKTVHPLVTAKSFKYMDKQSFYYTWGVADKLQKISHGNHYPIINAFARTHPSGFDSLWPKNCQWHQNNRNILGDLYYGVDENTQTIKFGGYPEQPGHYVFKFYIMPTDSYGDVLRGQSLIGQIGKQKVDITRGKTTTVSQDQFDKISDADRID